MKIPTRPAPSVPRNDPSRENFYQSNKPVGQVKPKKKPPPRPPPPKFNRKPDFTTSLIDLSAPLEDYLQAANANQDLFKPFSNDDFCKLKSSANNDIFKPMSSINNDYSKPKPNGNDDFFKRKPPLSLGNSSFFGSSTVNVNHLDLATGTSSSISEAVGPRTNVVAPTIIRAQTKAKKDFVTFQVNNVSRRELEANNYSPPMPTIPPPSPPKYVYEYDTDTQLTVPHGVALYSYTASHKDDLPLQVDDVVILLRQVNDEWFYGRVDEKEGMFPANFLDIRVPLPDLNNHFVTALYEFYPETQEDLKLLPGQRIKVLKRISQDWLYGESNGNFGQFPSNFVDRIPANI